MAVVDDTVQWNQVKVHDMSNWPNVLDHAEDDILIYVMYLSSSGADHRK